MTDEATCSCGRPATQWLGDARTPWCGTNDLPPLPGSPQWLQMHAEAEAAARAKASCTRCGQPLVLDDPDDPIQPDCEIDAPGYSEHVECHRYHQEATA